MSASISTYNLKKLLTLSAQSIGAVMEVGSDWSEIRVWMRANFTDLGSSPGLGTRFWLGVMTNPFADMSNGPTQGDCQHFVGGTITRPANWARNAGPPVYYSGVNYTSVAKVGRAEIFSNAGNSTLASADPDRRLCYGMRIVKGSPNFTTSWVHPNSGSVANALLDVPLQPGEMENIARQEAMTRSRDRLNEITGSALSYTQSSTNVDLAADEANGALTSLCVGWNRIDFFMRVHDLWAAVLR